LWNSWIQLRCTKWTSWTNLSQWMYFECGAWLTYLNKRKYMHIEKVTLRPVTGHCLDA
jgi:hypothetical protein